MEPKWTLAKARCLIKEALELKNIIYQIDILEKDFYNVKLKLKRSNIKRETYKLVEGILLIAILVFFISWFIKLINIKRISGKIL